MMAIRRTRFRVHAMRVLLALLAILAVLGWLAGTEPVLRWGARQVEGLSDGRLKLGTMHGSIFGPLRIEGLSFESEEQRFEAKEANLDWTPLALFRRHLRFNRVELTELRITVLKPSAEPVKLPETLRLPGILSAPVVTVGRLILNSGGKELVLSGIDLGVERFADGYQIKMRSVTSDWGAVQADLRLGDTRPFSISAHATVRQAKGLPYQLEADASGSLEQIMLKGKAEILDGHAAMSATLTPFASNPLAEANLTADSINPAVFQNGWPKAALGMTVSVASQGAEGLQGSFTLRNELPGTVDQSRLPLSEVSARFAGLPGQIDLSAVQLDLAGAGRFTGAGRVRDNTLQLDLATTSFNPAQVMGKMHPMRLAGTIRLLAEPGSQRVTADLRDPRFRFGLDADYTDGIIRLRDASIQAGSGRLSANGSVALAEGPRPFQLTGLLQGFNPADFGDYPAARVNGSFSAAGRLTSEPQATLDFKITDSHFRQHALAGQGSLSISATRLWNSEVSLKLAGNRLEARGALGNAGDRLSFRLDADNLAMVDPRLGGKGSATGTLEGRFADPSGNFDANLRDLSWGKQHRVASLHAKGRLDQGINGVLALDASVRGLVTPQLSLDRTDMQAKGTRTAHTLQFQAKNAEFDLESGLAGGWNDKAGWSGQVTDLVNRGRHVFSLKSPAALEVARQRVRLGSARLDVIGADLALHEFVYDAGQLASRGEFKGLALASLLRGADLETDLSLGGEWQITARDSVNGHAGLWRERGDVSVSAQPRVTLGLDGLSVKATAVNNRLQGELEASGTRLGRVKADGQSMLSLRDGSWGIAEDAPLQGRAELAVDSLAWVRRLFDRADAMSLDGALKAQMHADGTFGQPRLAGTASGDGLTLALPDQGLQLKEGRFRLELQDRILYLKDLTVRGGEGTLRGQGQLALAEGSPLMQLALKADRLELFSRPDRLLILSGTGDVSVAGKELKLVAKLKADRGLIELPEGGAPTISDDVVVLGRTGSAKKKRLPYAVKVDLDLDLGDRFVVKGKGLDAQLGGALKLVSVGGAMPSSRGSIRVVKGVYSAYGQRLEIDRGILNFQGPLDNPGLNIIALRKNQAVEAGVAVTGTALAPSVRLVSDPAVPDSEKLSWLVLGHGVEGSSGSEFNALQAAAGALLAAGDSVSLQQRIAHAAGLEEIGLKGAGGLENTVLTLGKRISSRAYLSFEQGLSGADTLVKINYLLTKRLSVRAQAGVVPAIDLFYSFSFD